MKKETDSDKFIKAYLPSITPNKEPLKVGDLFAVYGTLREGCGNHRALDLEGRAKYIGLGTVEGVLMSLGGYPGLYEQHPDIEGTQRVTVEVYEVTQEGLPYSLDRLEGYDCKEPRQSFNMYLRAPIEVTMKETEQMTSTVTADCYFYNYPVPASRLIESGDWKDRG